MNKRHYDPCAWHRLVALQMGPQGAPPTEFRLFAHGVNDTSKGPFIFDDKAAGMVMAAFANQGMDKLPFDFDHLMLGATDSSAAKAAGWFVPQVRGGELWATEAEFTPAAEQALSNREFRFFSPAVVRDKDNRIAKLVNVALTNLPATKNQMPLVAHDDNSTPAPGKEITMSDKLFRLLGADDEADALTIAKEWDNTTKELLSVTGTKSLNDLVASVKAAAALPAEVQRLSAEVTRYQAEAIKAEKDALIEKLSSGADACLTPGLRMWAEGQSVESLNAFAASAPKLGAVASHTQPASGDAVTSLSAEERHIAKQMGVSFSDLVAFKAAEKARQE